MKKIVVATGGFDPIHSGHIEYLKTAKKLGDYLIVGLNSDKWLKRKKGKFFLPFEERLSIIQELSCVDEVRSFYDDDNSAKSLLLDLCKNKKEEDKIIFVNGGDRTKENIPEMNIENIDFIFGVGGTNKKNSSSLILKNWESLKTKRSWGFYRILYQDKGIKVKELMIEPSKSISNQRHFKRSELWFISEGKAIYYKNNSYIPKLIDKYESILIPINTWHKLSNIDSIKPLKIIEIQYGDYCIEEDIERNCSYIG